MRKLIASLAVILATTALAADTADLDWRMIGQIWRLVKDETGAPPDLPMPPIEISSNMPAAARMMFQYPTQETATDRMIILINPTTLETYDRDMIDWGLGHELTHYALILEENGWDTGLAFYQQQRLHHCNRRFMKITRDIADLITSVYHDERARYQMYNQVQRSCVDQPHQ